MYPLNIIGVVVCETKADLDPESVHGFFGCSNLSTPPCVLAFISFDLYIFTKIKMSRLDYSGAQILKLGSTWVRYFIS